MVKFKVWTEFQNLEANVTQSKANVTQAMQNYAYNVLNLKISLNRYKVFWKFSKI